MTHPQEGYVLTLEEHELLEGHRMLIHSLMLSQ